MSCSDCTSGNSLPGSPKGTEENGVYLAKGSGQEGTKDRAIVVLTDLFGLAIPNPKIIADTIAERTGFDVWIPDLFNGALPTYICSIYVRCSPDTAHSGRSLVAPEVLDSFLPRRPGEKVGFWRKIKFFLTALVSIIPRYYSAARSAVVDPRVKEVCLSVLHPTDR